MSKEILVWTDIETFGLDPERHPILEIGFTVTDLELSKIASVAFTAWSPAHDKWYENLVRDKEAGGDTYVLDMHTNNGLFEEARATGLPTDKLEVEASRWLTDNNFTNQPMCGSSVGFDKSFYRAQMPLVLNCFHYRIIDNSTLKELCKRYNPLVYEKAPEKKQEMHRVLPDIQDTIDEFQFYRDEFLIW